MSGGSSFRTAVAGGFLIAITNPKTILFYAAFFPQFIDPTKPVGHQLLIMSWTFVGIALTIDTSYALLAARLRIFLTGESKLKLRKQITGTLLIFTGICMALIQNV
jgi:threonine/homoserine/homoserine lactone efflux protein